MKTWKRVDGIVCHLCKDVVISRWQHDFRYCQCKKVAIDGGRSYTRTLGEPDNYSFVTVSIKKKQPHRDRPVPGSSSSVS